MATTKAPKKPQSTDKGRKYVSLMQFADRFAFSESYVRKLIKNGDLKAGRVPRKDAKRETWRIPVSEVERFDKSLTGGRSEKKTEAG